MTHSPQHTPARHSTFTRLLREGWKSPHLVILALISTICVTAFDALIPLIAGTTIDAATGAQTARTHPDTITQLTALLLAVALGRYLVQFGRRYLAGALSHTLHFQLRTRIAHTLLRLDGPSHDELSTGHIVTRSISDLNAVQIMVAMAPLLFGNIVQVIVTICIIFVISPLLCSIAVAIIPILVGLSIYSRKVLFASTWSAQQTLADMNSHIEETLSGVRVVKAFAQEERETNTLTHNAGKVYQHMMRTARISARLKPLMQQLPSIALVITIGAGGYITYTGTITIGTFLAFSVYMTALTSVVSMLAGMVVQMQLGLASAQRVFDIIDITSPTQPAAPGAASTPSVGAHAASHHAAAPDTVDEGWGIDISHISYTNVLTDLSFTLQPATRTALVGPPGSGKTLLTHLLGGFYQPQSGQITLTNADTHLPYSTLPPAEIRSHVTCVFDDPFLFSTTIRDNLDFGRGFSDDELYDAARIACIDTFIDSLPNGLDTPIGERGHRLSGGQRQRIALARAILAQPKILILDDTTSAVDATTEAQIFTNLSTHLPHTTILIIAHRHSTLEYADHIAILDHGTIVGSGTREKMRTNPQLRTLMN
ncbi:MAG: ABC transporter ATP-binding protein, partial [Corynebacterium sp.]|uniref:ABC transporter ATP-binding protein n=1 Tax=Corynebacterium sp. TaxID=1720 RepID=UPI0026DCA69B